MSFYLIKFIKTIIFPPGIFLVMLLLALFFWRRKPLLSKRLVLSTLVLFYLAATPLVSTFLISWVEPYPALDIHKFEHQDAQAIVILGGGRHFPAPEYDGDTVSMAALTRLSYGSLLAHKTKLPVLVTGGVAPGSQLQSEAQLMANTLEQIFQIKVKWVEGKSLNTAENAIFSAEILKQEKISSIFLVTQAWHLARAVDIFERQGLTVIPAPTYFVGLSNSKGAQWLLELLPSTTALEYTRHALHEMLGRIWYWLRY
ncbi:MAG: YdcF family protein [Gammaproteobacteria bacterium]|nr:YdcF family protein [Gammaproteobacteria bacterium]